MVNRLEFLDVLRLSIEFCRFSVVLEGFQTPGPPRTTSARGDPESHQERREKSEEKREERRKKREERREKSEERRAKREERREKGEERRAKS